MLKLTQNMAPEKIAKLVKVLFAVEQSMAYSIAQNFSELGNTACIDRIVNLSFKGSYFILAIRDIKKDEKKLRSLLTNIQNYKLEDALDHVAQNTNNIDSDKLQEVFATCKDLQTKLGYP